MSLDLKVIQLHELPEILDFELKKQSELGLSEDDKIFESWHAKWRKESLEHYLPLGWSFLAREQEGQLSGYFLAQPLLFFEGMTQTLWVEHLQFSSLQARDQLCELAYKLAREKHFQKVVLPNQSTVSNAIKHLKPENWGPHFLQLITSKM